MNTFFQNKIALVTGSGRGIGRAIRKTDHARRSGGGGHIFMHVRRGDDRGTDDCCGWWIYTADTEVKGAGQESRA